ncbi:protein PLANT CADMIUM RESISTANCE 8 [Dendrobium catenatum]|uniref:Protein PLANT CADMIUM RESISTANCE 8 n=1 Tax=Dendrobium catenatum TaxID=906689 RepID=A0A2I0XDD3_9ASPA|nr:protein PLANT CADMIUM RESISTANCE 8 [Dendrobium catenatum]PKU85915.1 Protein PLANT CADMIUM RESISTANCE 8 [Dendrobium catenatum]
MARQRPEEEEITAGSEPPPTSYFDAPQYSPPRPPPAASATYINGPPPPARGTPVNFAPVSPMPAYDSKPPGSNIGMPWSSGMFDCGLNQTNAIMTAFFPCVTFGQIAEILDEGETSCTLGSFMYILMVPALLTCWIIGSNYRKKMRKKYNIVEAPSEDWTVHLFCSCCALCQEYRELQHRGIDPSLGWMGYQAQKQWRTSTVPPMNQFMSE